MEELFGPSITGLVPQAPPDSAEGNAPRYRLPVFEGPLDLLLYLIQKNEIEITDIPIVEIAQQYEEYLGQMKELDLDIAADFVLMAATLIHIKSRMLLPTPAVLEDGTVEDPRAALVQQLQEYQKVKELSVFLREQEEMGAERFPRGGGEVERILGEGMGSYDVDMFDLVNALQEVLKRVSDSRERLVYAPEISLTTCIGEVLKRLEEHGSLLFVELFERGSTRIRIIVTFLALLELVKQKVALLYQDHPLGPIRVVLAA